MDETQIIVRRNYLDDSWRVYDFTPKSVATRRKRKSPQDADQKFAPKREKKSPDWIERISTRMVCTL